METPTKETPPKSMTGIEFVRHLMKVKEQAQLDAEENYRNNPELWPIIDELKRVNGKQKAE